MDLPLEPIYDLRATPAPLRYPVVTVMLPSDLSTELLAHCERSGDRPEDVVADAVTLWLDEQAGPVSDAEIATLHSGEARS